MTYLGALSHGDERLALHRDGDLIHWEAAWRGSSTGPPRRAHEATGDLVAVSRLLGHASVETTQIYTQVTADTLREHYQQAHPRAT